MTAETFNARADEIKSELSFLAMEHRMAVKTAKSLKERITARQEVLAYVQKQARETARKGQA